jgi:alpha-N-arabinofuranosidase
VKFWEIDNETWGMGPRKYSKTVSEFSRVIRAKYPELTIIACGSYAYDNDGWDKAIIDATAKDIDYISPHYYNGLHGEPDYKDDPRNYEAHLKSVGEYIRKSANPDIKIYVSEWNLMSTDWRAGLYAGSILNGFERIGDMVKMACPALWLRRSWARSWDNALINFDHRTWFPAPNYIMMKLWRDHYAPNLLQLDGPEQPLNITATKSADGDTVYIKAVNPEKYPVEAQVTVGGLKGNPRVTYLLIDPGEEAARNTLEEPHRVAPKAAEAACKNGEIRFTIPALSAGVLTVEQAEF